LALEHLETRLTPATFNAGDVPSLIADIHTANGNGVANTINLTAPTGIYTLTAADNSTDGNTGLPVITSALGLTINGNFATIERSTTTGTPDFRLFDVASGAALTLKNVRVENGLAFGGGSSASGGAIYNQGKLVLNGVSLVNNEALGITGTALVGANQAGGNAAGGAIWSSGGSLTLIGNMLIEKDYAFGGLAGPLGQGGNAFGGGIYANLSKVSIGPGSIIESCDVIGASGGLGASGGSGSGGGLYATASSTTLVSVSLTSAIVQHNFAGGGSGGQGASGGNGSGGGLFVNDAALTLSGDFIQYNTAAGAYGGNGANGSPTGGTGGAGGNASGGGLYSSGGSITESTSLLVQNNNAYGGFGGRGGTGSGAGGTGGYAFGGGMCTIGTAVRMTASPVLQSNQARGGFGSAGGNAVFIPGTVHGVGGGFGGNGSNGLGGALYATLAPNSSPFATISVTLENATLQNNQAVGGDGLAGGDGFLRDGTPGYRGGSGGNGGNSLGGALYLAQNATLLNDTFKTNVAGYSGAEPGNSGSGGLGLYGGNAGNGGYSAGGALFVSSGKISLSSSTIENNTAAGSHGGNSIGPSFASGLAGIGGSGSGGAVAIFGGTVSVKSCDLRSNLAVGGADGVMSGDIIRSDVGGSGSGGGLFVFAGTVSISSSIIDTNEALGAAGGNIAHGGPSAVAGSGGTATGGGVDIAGGTVSVSSCSLESNIAQGGNGGFVTGSGSPGAGGAAYGGGLYISGGTLHLTLDDVETNRAVGGFSGGGVQSTFVFGGGLYVAGGLYTADAFTLVHIINNTPTNLNPAQIRKAYGIDQVRFGTGTVGNGAGQTIALVVIGVDSSLISDLQYFDRQLFGSGPDGAQLLDTFGSYSGPQAGSTKPWLDLETDPNFPPRTDYTPPQISKHDVEADIDVEWAHAIAPMANIVVVQTGSIQSGTFYASELRTLKPQLGISIIASSSYHFPTFHPDDYADPNVTYLGITGDTGTSIDSQQLGFSLNNYPASSPDIIAVGGTTLTLNPDASYGSETGWGFAGPSIFLSRANPVVENRLVTWSLTGGGFSGLYYVGTNEASFLVHAAATWTTTVTDSFTLGKNDKGLEISATWPASTTNTKSQFSIYDNGTFVRSVEVNERLAPTGTVSTQLGLNPTMFQELCTLTNVNVGDTISVVLQTDLEPGQTLAADTVGFGPDDASGGGLSNEPQPSYQNGLVIHNGNTIISSNGTRANPDVAFNGDYINSPVEFYDEGSVLEGESASPIRAGAGTSLGAPAWAGLIAIADQGLAMVGHAPITTAEALAGLYRLPAGDFHDETTGYNGYSAGPGYDLVTGLGSPVANLFIPDLVKTVAPVAGPLVYQAPEAKGPNNLTLTQVGPNIEILNGNSKVVASAPQAQTTAIDIIGAAITTNTLTIPFGSFSSATSVDFDGGGSGTLNLEGGTLASETDNGSRPLSGTISLNGSSIAYTMLAPIVDTTTAANFKIEDPMAGDAITAQDNPNS
jgi:hypothetical protein